MTTAHRRPSAADSGDRRPYSTTRIGYLIRRVWDERHPAAAISHAARLVYFPVPKAGSSTILSLMEACEAGNEPRFTDVRNGLPSVLEWARPRTLKAWQSYVAFTVVRNPWHRLVSCYLDKVRGSFEDGRVTRREAFDGFKPYNHLLRRELFHPGMSFEEFATAVAWIPDAIANTHFRSQVSRFTTPTGRILPRRILRLEQPDALAELLPAAAWQTRARRTVSRDWREFYTDRTIDLVARRYQKDIAMLGYEQHG